MTVRLSNYPGIARGFVGGVKTELDGVELMEVRDLQLSCPADGVATLTASVNVVESLDVTLDARVHVTFVVPYGMTAITETDEAGRTHITAVLSRRSDQQ